MGGSLLEVGRKQLMVRVKSKEKEWSLLIHIALKGSLLMAKDLALELSNIIMEVYMRVNGEMAKWMGKGYFLIRLT